VKDKDFGTIEVKTEFDEHGKPIKPKFTHKGGQIIKMSGCLLDRENPEYVVFDREHDRVRIGPYQLLIIDWSPLTDLYYAINTNERFWWGKYIQYKFEILVNYLKFWIVWKLGKFGLADLDPAVYPSWGDIKLLNWIKRMVSK